MRIKLTHLIPTFLCLASCARAEIMNEELRRTGRSLAEESVELMTAPTNSTIETLEDDLDAIECALAKLALGHDQLGLSGPELPEEAVSRVDPAGLTGSLHWDGRDLEAVFPEMDGRRSSLQASLRFQGYRNEFPGQGTATTCWWGSPTGTADGAVECPALIDRTLIFTRPQEGLTVWADFGIVLDGDECGAGGQVELAYVIRDEDGTRGGTLEASYEGCGRIRLLTPR
jgi:hypothetical protein